MNNISIIGLGDMGSDLAKNLMANGFSIFGLDLKPERQAAFTDMGGTLVEDTAELGRRVDAAFIMVMNWDQAKSAILGSDGLVENMEQGGVVIQSATIKPHEAVEIGAAMQGSGIDLIDTHVSGGFPGAQGGTLTMMAAATDDVMARARPVLEAVTASIHHVGTKAGDEQRKLPR